MEVAQLGPRPQAYSTLLPHGTFQVPRGYLLGASQAPLPKTSLYLECTGFQQPRPTELTFSCPVSISFHTPRHPVFVHRFHFWVKSSAVKFCHLQENKAQLICVFILWLFCKHCSECNSLHFSAFPLPLPDKIRVHDQWWIHSFLIDECTFSWEPDCISCEKMFNNFLTNRYW